MTGLFSEKWINPTGGFDGAFYGRPIQLWYQMAGILTAIGTNDTQKSSDILFVLRFCRGMYGWYSLSFGLDHGYSFG